MKHLVCGLLCAGLGLGEVAAQQAVAPPKTEFLDSTFTVIPSATGARYRRETTYTDSVGGTVRDYYLSGQLQHLITYTNIEDETAHGTSESWYENGQLETHSESGEGGLSGEWRAYYPTGQLKQLAHYRAGKLLDSQCLTADGRPMPCPLIKEVMPVYPEGDGGGRAIVQAVAHNFKYPRSAVKARLKGRVLVAFAVDAHGDVVNVHIKQGLSPSIDAAAVQAVQQLKRFTPGTQDGKPVKVRFTVPLNLDII